MYGPVTAPYPGQGSGPAPYPGSGPAPYPGSGPAPYPGSGPVPYPGLVPFQGQVSRLVVFVRPGGEEGGLSLW